MLDQQMLDRMRRLVTQRVEEQEALCRKLPQFTGETCESTDECRMVKGLTQDLEYLQHMEKTMEDMLKKMKDDGYKLLFTKGEIVPTGTNSSAVITQLWVS